MNIIVNVDKNWAIGRNGALLFPIAADLQNFKRLTLHKVVVMGRKTLESLPGGKPLKERLNVVLSASMPETEGLYICRSIDEMQQLFLTEPFAGLTTDDVFVIGGETVYRQLLPLCSKAYITKVEASAAEPDAFFPDIDSMDEWRITGTSERFFQAETAYRFFTYQRN